MFRNALNKLVEWKNRSNHKPLIIRGARQTGKTWLMKEFGQLHFQKTLYINFENSPVLKKIFVKDLSIPRIITALEIFSGVKITDNTLIIFDEVQEVPQALTALKYFNEEVPQYHIVCAGSLLGVAIHQGISFPVGKVEFLDLYPMSFYEFLHALGDSRAVSMLQNSDFEMAEIFHDNLTEKLKMYYFIGGMPEVVDTWVKTQDFNLVKNVQQRILTGYEHDFSKHAGKETLPRERMLWNSIPGQLARENRKFLYNVVKEGARAKDYETALLWLSDSGLVTKIHRVSSPLLPLKSYEDTRAFKLFHLDTGLLSCMAGLKPHAILENTEVFREFKGALTEQYVLTQLKTLDNLEIFYWTNDRGSAEIDFLITDGIRVIPIEVKASINLKSKSLKIFEEKFNPLVSLRISLSDFRKKDNEIFLPLYAVESIISCIENP